MKNKPLFFEKLETAHTSFKVSFFLENNVTFICGDSGTGKSAVFSFLQELAATDKKIRCINYLDINKNYKNTIKKSKEKLIVIDNADILLDDSMRQYIALDENNQYIIIGRNPSGLMLCQDDIYELKNSRQDEKTIFSLDKAFDD